MFTVFAIDLECGEDTEAQCPTLGDALTHLRELITSDLGDPKGPRFSRYGVYFDWEAAMKFPGPTAS